MLKQKIHSNLERLQQPILVNNQTEDEFVEIIHSNVAKIANKEQEIDKDKFLSCLTHLSLNRVQMNALLCVLERDNNYYPSLIQLIWELVYYYNKMMLIQT